jgi:predicted ester cyclase
MYIPFGTWLTLRTWLPWEWSFDAEHKGNFANIAASGKKVQVPECSFYEYDLKTKRFRRAGFHFDFGTLLRQIGA